MIPTHTSHTSGHTSVPWEPLSWSGAYHFPDQGPEDCQASVFWYTDELIVTGHVLQLCTYNKIEPQKAIVEVARLREDSSSLWLPSATVLDNSPQPGKVLPTRQEKGLGKPVLLILKGTHLPLTHSCCRVLSVQLKVMILLSWQTQ